MTSVSSWEGALVAACLCLGALRVEAAPSAAEKETARKLVKSGRVKQKAGELKAALEDFKAAHAIMGVPITGVELGKAQIEAGMLVEARDTLLGVSRSTPAPREPPLFAKARGEAKALSKELEPKIPELTVELVHAPAGVRIMVDNVEIAAAAHEAPLALNPGIHVIVARLGERETRTEASLSEGEKHKLSFDLSALAAPKAKPKPAAAKSGSETNAWVYVGFGVAGAGVLVGGVTGMMALSKGSKVDGDCVDKRCPPSTHDDIDAGRTLGSVSTVAFLVAGVGAGVGIYGLLNPKKSTPAEPGDQLALDVWVGPTGIGAHGRF
ncbi:MAG: hypothetical protein IPI67_34945 [Myxococcales bacterium]|nr:hypothetical protein [Myxococcales bacterium]